MIITKRDGRTVKYDGSKIRIAVSKAIKEVRGTLTPKDYEICQQVEQEVKETLVAKNYPLTVEGIQDSVENTLMSLGTYNDVAKAYILYREKRNRERFKPHPYKYLSEEFLKPYQQIKNPFPHELGMMVYKRTYARPLPDSQRREDWWETVARVVEFSTILEIQARNRQGLHTTPELIEQLEDKAERMYKHMFYLGLFPSGRSLWIGGTKSSYKYSLSNFNCFSRDTEFITDKGIKSFEDFDDGDKVNVLNANGSWSEATVKNFGEDEIVTLYLRKGRMTKTIQTTKNHIWFIQETENKDIYVEKETQELKIGDQFKENKEYSKQHKPNNDGLLWTLDRMEYTGKKEPVWCVQEPQTNTFTLADDILTHNCSFLAIDTLNKFSEMFFVLMLGTGVGLSVERKYISKLPKVRTNIQMIHKDYTPKSPNQRLEYTEFTQPAHNVIQINVGDSKSGWSEAMRMYLDIISSKQYTDIEIILINYDSVRPKGEPLKTFGGFASGHGNLKTMFEKIDSLISSKMSMWEHLKPIDVLDMATIIAENVVSGGVRRSALIVFADEDEKDVIEAKNNLYTQTSSGEWVENKAILHRALSNNTIKYYKKPSLEQLNHHINTMRYTGEPGFDNMEEALRRREDAVGFNPLTKSI